MKRLMTGLALMASTSSFAAQVYTNDAITFKNDGIDIVTAYRSVWSCSNWYVTPSRFEMKNHIDFYGSEKFVLGKDGNFLGLGLVHSLNADISPVQKYDENLLKSKIANHINALTDEDREKIYYKGCPYNATANSITINSQMIYQAQNMMEADYRITGTKGLDFDGLDIFSNAFEGGSANIEFDISSPSYLQNLKSLFGRSSKIGARHYKMDSKEYIYGASIKLHGKLSAEYIASLEKTSCNTSSSENGFQLAGLTAAGAGGFLGGGSSSSSKTCTFEWLSQLKNAENGVRLEIEYDKSRDFSSKSVQICDDNECTTVSLYQYVETMLLEKWLSINFIADYKQLSDNLFNMTIKRKTGVSDAVINNKVEINETQVQGIIYSAPIYTKKDTSFQVPSYILEDERRQCAKRNYTASLLENRSNLTSLMLIPVPQECY